MVTTSRNRTDTTTRKKTPSKPKASSVTQSPTNGNGVAPSNSEVLRRLYLSLLRSRMAEEYADRHLSDAHYDFSIGHEAVVAGATAELEAQDTIAASARSFSALLARGARLKDLLILGGKSNSYSSGCGAVVSAASLPLDPFNTGTGIALTHKLEKKRNVVVAFCDEGSPSLERWHEGLKFAAVHKLPILYVIKGGSPSPSSPGPQNAQLEDFSFIARDYGFPGIIVDGSDVVAVWRVAHESVHRARSGAGPTIIDCRKESGQDPLAHMEHYMKKRNVWDDAWKKQVSSEIKAEIDAAL